MSKEREEAYQILELGKHEKNLHHKKGFGGLLFIDLSMIKFSKLSSYIRQLDKENQELKKQVEEKQNPFKGIFAQVNDDTLLRDCGNMNAEINELKTQQKEFIKYLQEELNIQIQEESVGCEITNKRYILEEILQKYKSIIGGK